MDRFAREDGVFLPLNPIDVFKNYGDYSTSLQGAPNMSFFSAKFLLTLGVTILFIALMSMGT